MEDSRIIELFWSRSERAVEETARKYGAYCHRIAYTILRCREDTEECVSDTYLRVWESVPPHRPRELRLYLGTIVRRLALGRYERLHAEKRGGGQIPLLLDELQECVADTGDRVADTVELNDLLNRFLSALSPRDRTLFVLRYWYTYSIEEIAAGQGMKRDAVAVALFRARRKLKEELAKEGVSL